MVLAHSHSTMSHYQGMGSVLNNRKTNRANLRQGWLKLGEPQCRVVVIFRVFTVRMMDKVYHGIVPLRVRNAWMA